MNQNETTQIIVADLEKYIQDRLLEFCDHLSKYEGLEDVRFDFMLIDFNQKNAKPWELIKNVEN